MAESVKGEKPPPTVSDLLSGTAGQSPDMAQPQVAFLALAVSTHRPAPGFEHCPATQQRCPLGEPLTAPPSLPHLQMALLPPAAQGKGRACLSPQDACARPHLTHVFLLPSLPPHSDQAARLTSPPLAYSITKHRRSWVWKAYFRACEGNQNAGTEGTWTGTLCLPGS